MRHIRLWKLGSLEHRIIPTRESIEYLSKILKHARCAYVGDKITQDENTLDIIWGPDLDVVEVSGNTVETIKIDGVEPEVVQKVVDGIFKKGKL